MAPSCSESARRGQRMRVFVDTMAATDANRSKGRQASGLDAGPVRAGHLFRRPLSRTRSWRGYVHLTGAVPEAGIRAKSRTARSSSTGTTRDRSESPQRVRLHSAGLREGNDDVSGVVSAAWQRRCGMIVVSRRARERHSRQPHRRRPREAHDRRDAVRTSGAEHPHRRHAGFQPSRDIEEFSRDLLEDVMPLVERTYRVTRQADNRGIAGLSMGGNQARQIGLSASISFTTSRRSAARSACVQAW